MPTAIAGIVGGQVAIVGSTVIQQVQQNINIIHKYAITAIQEVSRNISEVSSRSAQGAIQSLGMLGSATGLGVFRVTEKAFKYFYKVVKDVVVHPRGYMVALAMLRLINLQVPSSPDPYIRTLDDITNRIESISVPYVTLPRVSMPLDKYADVFRSVVEQHQETVKRYLSHVQTVNVEVLVNTVARQWDITEPCREPAWYDVSSVAGWMVCNLRRGLGWLGLMMFRAVLELGRLSVELVLNLWLWMLEAVKWLVYIALKVMDVLGEAIVNTALLVIELLLNAIVYIANQLLNFFVKLPARLFIQFVLKPMVYLVVVVFKWLKDNVSIALCWYLKVSPLAVGLTTMIESFKRGGLFTGIIGGVLAGVGMGIATSVFAPECTSYNIVADARTPPEPVPVPEIPVYVPVAEFTSRIRLSFREAVAPVPVPRLVFSASLRIGSTETVGAPVAREAYFSAALRLSYSE